MCVCVCFKHDLIVPKTLYWEYEGLRKQPEIEIIRLWVKISNQDFKLPYHRATSSSSHSLPLPFRAMELHQHTSKMLEQGVGLKTETLGPN